MTYSSLVGVETGAGIGANSSDFDGNDGVRVLDGVAATNPENLLLPCIQINESNGYQNLGIEERQTPSSNFVVCDRNRNHSTEVISLDENDRNSGYVIRSNSQNVSEGRKYEENGCDTHITSFGHDSKHSLHVGNFPSSVRDVPVQIILDPVRNSSSHAQNGEFRHGNGKNLCGSYDDDSNNENKKNTGEKNSNRRGGNSDHSNENPNSRNNQNNIIDGNGDGDDDKSTETHTPQNNNSQQNHKQQPSDATVDEDDQNQLLFSCQCDSARTIATLLSCLRRVVTSTSGTAGTNYGGGRTSLNASTPAGTMGETSSNKVQHATVYAGPSGLTFHVQHGLAKQSQCSVDMPKGLFRDYFVGEEEVWLEESEDEGENGDEESDGGGVMHDKRYKRNVTKEIIRGGEFAINLTTVLECFSILSRNNKSIHNAPTPKSGGSGGIASNPSSGEFATLERVPLCMSYDRGTALFHLEFLEGGNHVGTGTNVDASTIGGGVLVTCEVPGIAVSDDVDDGPDGDHVEDCAHPSVPNHNSNTGLASAFRSSPLLARAILYSEALQAAIAELYDVPGASIVQVAFSKEGIEFGTVGPRSEVWISVPFHCSQQGMYVGMECYNNESVTRYTDEYVSNPSKNFRKYPLGTFLSGMRGLDVGCETCISVNARGMMAIQHQVTREGYYEGSDCIEVRPSFVDFIMTCIEEVDEMEEDSSAQNVDDEDQSHHWTGSQRNGEIALESRQRSDSVEIIRRRENHGKTPSEQGSVDNNDQGNKNQELDVNGSDEDQAQGIEKRTEPSATARILGELELDQDLVSSKRKSFDRRKSALEDIRRRREGKSRQSVDYSKERNTNTSLATADSDVDAANNYGSDVSSVDEYSSAKKKVGRKRRSSVNDTATPRKTRSSKETTRNRSEADEGHDYNRDSQSLPNEDDEDSELDDSLDVTTEIPQLFSRPSSMSTSRRRSRGNAKNGTCNTSDVDESEEPKMMYGDTRLEFTQDGYESGSGISM
ncbi:hypothetical protein ACHAXS_012056 [Conticribra weissflogii]